VPSVAVEQVSILRLRGWMRPLHNGQNPVPVTGSATFPAPDTEDEDLGEDLGGLDDLLASLRSEEQPAPKRGRGRAKQEAPAKDFKAVL